MARRGLSLLLAAVGIAVALGLASCGTSMFGLVGNATAGAADFASLCQQCHTFGEIKPVSNLIVNDMGTIDPAMSDIFLTNQQIADLQAFFL